MKKTTQIKSLLFLTFMMLGITLNAQTPGESCDDPIVVTTLPFNDSGNTSTYGNNYTSTDVPVVAPNAVIDGDGSKYYLIGDEVVYAYTPTTNEVLTISTTNDDDWIMGFYRLSFYINCRIPYINFWCYS